MSRAAGALPAAFALALGAACSTPRVVGASRVESGASRVEDGAPCAVDGSKAPYTGPMDRIAPVAQPGAPPECTCSSGAWACPAVAAPPPPPKT